MFIYFDADEIGNHLELLLLDGKLDRATIFSEQVTNAMCELRNSLEQITDMQIHLFGGDDLIAQFPKSSLSLSKINKFRKDFEIRCGTTISCGAGEQIEDALINLRRAKLMGKNCIVGIL